MIEDIPNIYLVDGDESVRIHLGDILRATGYHVMAFASVADLMAASEAGFQGCLILDVHMPDGLDGLELQEALNRRGETIPVVFITGDAHMSFIVRAVKNGAFDVLSKPVDPGALLQSVRAALESRRDTDEAAFRKRDLKARMRTLTPEELDVFIRVVDGQLNKQIAMDCDCSERTVKARRAQVMRKMAASTLTELVEISLLLGPDLAMDIPR